MARSGTAVHPRLRRAAGEAWLTSAAARGDLDAFAALLERYEARTFNLAFRILDSEEEAVEVTRTAFLETLRGLRESPHPHEISFAIALATAASEGSFAALEERGGSSPRAARRAAAGDADGRGEDRDGGLALEDWHERMRSANAGLPALGRQVLALRELGGLSYGAIAEVMDTDPHSVAELVSLARLDLRDKLRGSDVAASEGPSEDCFRAAPLMAMRDDDELEGHAEDADWLITHLVSCRACRVRLDAMQEARLTYAAWDPIGPPPSLRRGTLARAVAIAVPEGSGARGAVANGAAGSAQAVAPADGRGGAAHTARRGMALPGSGALALAAGKIGAIARGTTVSRAAAAPVALAREISSRASQAASAAARSRPSNRLPAPERRSRRRREALLAGGWAAVVALGLVALAVGGVFDGAEGDDAGPRLAAPAAFERVTPPASEPKPRPARKRKKRRTDVVSPAPVPQEVRPVPVVAAPPATPQRRPTSDRRRLTRRPRRESSSPRRTPPRAKVIPKAPAEPQVPQRTQPAPPPGATPAPTTPPEQAPSGCANPAGKPTPCPPG